MFIGLRKEMPRRSRAIRTVKKPKKPLVVTISLVDPPRSYRSDTKGHKVVKIYF